MPKSKREGTGMPAGAESDLRQRAEEKASITAEPALNGLGLEETTRLIHELRVHQIELEMQNEELRRAQEELEASRSRYVELYDFAPVGYLTLSEQGLILEVNLTAAKMLNQVRGSLLERPFSRFVSKDDADAFYLHRKELFCTGEPWSCEIRLVRPGDDPFWVQLEGTLAQGRDGKPTCQVTIIDITKRKHSEEALRESEQHFRTLANNGTALIWTSGPDKLCDYFNEPWLRYTGRTTEQELGNGWAEGVHPDDFDRCLQIYVSHFDQREPFLMEYRLRKADGVYGWILDQGNPRYDSQGKFIGYIGYCYDITERKRAEEALEHLRNRLTEAQKIAHVGSFEYIAATRTTVWSEEEYHIYGLDPAGPPPSYADMLRKSIHPDDAVLLDRTFNEAMRSGAVYELEHRIMRPDGSVRWVYDRALPYFGEQGELLRYIGSTLDITERKEAYEALRVTSESLALAQRSAGAGLWDWDMETGILTWSPELLRLFGLPAGTVAGFDVWRNLLHPEDRVEAERKINDAIRDRQRLENEYRIVRPDGNTRWISALGDTIYDATGKPERMAGICLDITERKQAQEALRASEARYALVLGAVNDGFWDWNVPSGNAFFSPAYYSLLEYNDGEFPADYESWRLLVHPEDIDRVEAELRWSVESGKGFSIDLRMKLKSGEWRWVSTRGRAIEWDEDGKALRMVGTLSDVSERKHLEDQLRQSQKMEAVGQLAGGVAHDFNNILQVILMNVEMLRAQYAPSTSNREILDGIAVSAERAADLTRQLLAFSRRQLIRQEYVDLNDLIGNELMMLRRIIGENIVLDFTPGHFSGKVLADKGQVEQVFMNLCVNARDAMPQGGKLSIATGGTSFDAEYCRSHPWASEGRYLYFSVVDSGQGMDAETVSHIFEPFFTTKGVGEGTGLGLATVYGIVKHHQGLIHVCSEPDVGSVFKVYFPAVNAPDSPVEITEEVRPQGGNETILVAEDESPVLRLVSVLLGEAGYTVLPASDGNEALKVYEAHKDAISLAILDVVMPGLSGRQVMDKIKAEGGNMGFLFCSGYSEASIHVDFVIQEGLHLVQKPYRTDDLLRAVRLVLDSGDRR